MTIQEMITELREKIAAQLEARAAAEKRMSTIFAAVEARGGDRDLTDDEQTAFDEARAAGVAADTERAALEARVADLEAEAAARDAAAAAEKRFTTDRTATEAISHRVQVTNDRGATYRDGGRHSFFSDAWRMTKRHDFEAETRVRTHMEEMRRIGADLRDADGAEHRAVGSAAFGGLVVPQYLVDEFATVLRNGRAFANAVRRMPLPDSGMTFNVPRGQTGSSAASQATENAAVSETNADFDNDLTVNVRTIAGQQTVSRQSLERGTPGLDRLVFDDLVSAYAAELDAQLINGAGTGGTHLGVLALGTIGTVTYTDATPTLAELWPKLADADQQVATNRKLAANLRVMHPRRWGFVTAAVDSQGRPLVNTSPSDAVNAMGAQAAGMFGEGQLAGVLKDLPVLLDANVPTNLGTNEDAIINLRRQDPVLWEEGDGVPRELAFEEIAGNSLGVTLVVYGYSAFTADRRPEGIVTIEGTGLIAPTF